MFIWPPDDVACCVLILLVINRANVTYYCTYTLVRTGISTMHKLKVGKTLDIQRHLYFNTGEHMLYNNTGNVYRTSQTLLTKIRKQSHYSPAISA